MGQIKCDYKSCNLRGELDRCFGKYETCTIYLRGLELEAGMFMSAPTEFNGKEKYLKREEEEK